MATVDANAIAANVRRREKREPHDVVPVHVGHEHMVGLRRARAVTRDRTLTERANARAEVAEHVFRGAGLDLDAWTMAAVGAGARHPEAIDVRVELQIGRASCRERV